MEYEGVHEAKETRPITLNETCVIGSVFFRDYQKDGTEGNVRGHEAIDSLTGAINKGCKAAIIIAPDTDPKFVSDLKQKLSTLGDKSKNVVWQTQSEPGLSSSRRQALQLARAMYPESRAFIMQEIEKDLTGSYEDFVSTLSDDRALVMMNRGINIPYNKNPWPNTEHLGANLPPEQFWGERHQNIEMANQEEAAGLTKNGHYWDRLNGTRIIRNEPMKIGDVTINPSDLILLKYEYSDGYTETDRTNKIDDYSAGVYNLIPILEALGAGHQIAEVAVKYLHPERQREQEMNPEVRANFKKKRLKHKTDLPAINFDIVANIKEWKSEGKWPSILIDAIKSDGVLKIKHFNNSEYYLTGAAAK